MPFHTRATPIAVLLLTVAMHVPADAQTFRRLPESIVRDLRQSRVHPDSSVKLVQGSAVQEVAPTPGDFQMRVGAFLTVPTRGAIQTTDGRERFYFPVRAVTQGETGAPFDLQAFLEPTTAGLLLADDGLTYAASFLVGVVDQERPSERRRLPEPVQVILIGDQAGFDKPQIPIRFSNSPFEVVQLAGRPSGDEVEVKMKVSFATTELTRRFPVVRPAVDLEGPSFIEGLGIGEATVQVQLSPGSGTQTRQVQLRADGGVLRPNQVEATEITSAHAAYRGRWLGADTVLARSVGLSDGRLPIELRFPWGFLAAALLGGGLGAWVLRLLRPRRAAQALSRYFIGGVAFGLLVACLYVLGVNVTPVALPTETVPVAIFAIAAIGAIVAIPLVSKYSEGFKHFVEGESGGGDT